MYLGLNIKHLRRSKKISQADLADQLGVGRNMVSAYENETSSPRLEGFLKMAELFEVDLDDFVYKDLSKGGATKPVERSKTEEQTVDNLLNLLVRIEKQYRTLEDRIKTEEPDLAKKWGIS